MATHQVKETKNYKLFKLMSANRVVNENHVDALVKSMRIEYFLSPILVNEDMEVIDGQHRLEAAKRIGLPVYYVVQKGATISTVQALNSNSKNWTAVDYLNCYVQLGYPEYINFKNFIEEYGYIMTVGAVVANGVSVGGNFTSTFQKGLWKFKDINQAYETANKLKRIKIFYAGYKRKSFILALMNCMKREGFVFEEFLSKLSLQSSLLKDCANTDQYVDIIEGIYNYKRSDKINLRFDLPRTA